MQHKQNLATPEAKDQGLPSEWISQEEACNWNWSSPMELRATLPAWSAQDLGGPCY